MDEIILSPVKLSELGVLIETSVRKVFDESSSKPKSDSNRLESDLINIKEASQLLGLAVPTIYAKVSERLIPHCKVGKKLFFSREQLDRWVKSGQRKTIADLQGEAKDFINSKAKLL